MSPSAESASGCVQMPLQILPNNPFRACNLALLVPRTPPINDYSLVMTQGEGRRTTPEPETLTALDFFRAEHPDPLASLNATHRRLQSCDYYYATTNSAQVSARSLHSYDVIARERERERERGDLNLGANNARGQRSIIDAN